MMISIRPTTSSPPFSMKKGSNPKIVSSRSILPTRRSRMTQILKRTSMFFSSSVPEFRAGLRYPAADPDRRDLRCKPLGVELDGNAAKSRRASRRLKPACGQFGRESADGFFLFHADHRIIIPGHASIGHKGRAMRQDLVVGRGHMGMGANNQRNPAVGEMCEGLLLAGSFGMEIDHGGIAAASQGAGL